MSVVEPPPYEGPATAGDAPWGGEPIDFHQLVNIHGKRMVRRWTFRAGDPHRHHDMYLRVLPDGRYSLDATADRFSRVWLFPTQAEAETAAERMRGALVWSGNWAEVSPAS